MNKDTYRQYKNREEIYQIVSMPLSFTFLIILYYLLTLLGVAMYGLKIFGVDPANVHGFWHHLKVFTWDSGLLLAAIFGFVGHVLDRMYWPYFFRTKETKLQLKLRSQLRSHVGGNHHE